MGHSINGKVLLCESLVRSSPWCLAHPPGGRRKSGCRSPRTRVPWSTGGTAPPAWSGARAARNGAGRSAGNFPSGRTHDAHGQREPGEAVRPRTHSVTAGGTPRTGTGSRGRGTNWSARKSRSSKRGFRCLNFGWLQRSTLNAMSINFQQM